MRHVFISLLLVVTALQGTVASAASLTAEFVDAQGKPLTDAVLTLRGATAPPVGSLKADMDQRDVQFAPHVLAVRSGTQISFPNSDQIRHQVYSFSTPKRFELRLYGGTPSAPVLFDKPGVVVLGCNVHDNMIGYVYVTDDGWFGVSNDKGTLTLDQVPAGHYTVTLWHPQAPDMLPVSGGDIDIPAGGLKQRFSIAVQSNGDATPAAPPSSAFGDAFHKAAHE
ncbi:methylamine utilization protein [Pseudomonas sp. KU26590]|uniref:methylamine utilization protein n=1 Tax=Pseudomonas sp. KU26590 TaxID=2991051 RepID=UPI00223D3CBD|nr:methylamine utilization protein [Pseudomonas sp. KU26590]UZJ61574.1 methylamine utilization protein [Pseudomonas sp. KU26590]